jgi:hypothetical protein
MAEAVATLLLRHRDTERFDDMVMSSPSACERSSNKDSSPRVSAKRRARTLAPTTTTLASRNDGVSCSDSALQDREITTTALPGRSTRFAEVVLEMVLCDVEHHFERLARTRGGQEVEHGQNSAPEHCRSRGAARLPDEPLMIGAVAQEATERRRHRARNGVTRLGRYEGLTNRARCSHCVPGSSRVDTNSIACGPRRDRDRAPRGIACRRRRCRRSRACRSGCRAGRRDPARRSGTRASAALRCTVDGPRRARGLRSRIRSCRV